VIHQLFRLEAEKIDAQNLHKSFRNHIQQAKEARQARGELRNYGDIYPELLEIVESVRASGLRIAFSNVTGDKKNAYIIGKKKDLRPDRKSTPWTALFLEWMCIHSFEHVELFYEGWGQTIPLEFEGHRLDGFSGHPETPASIVQTDSGLLKSGGGTEKAIIIFENLTAETASVFWLDYTGAEKRYFDLEPNEKFSQLTFISHSWIVRHAVTRRKICAVTVSQEIEEVQIT